MLAAYGPGPVPRGLVWSMTPPPGRALPTPSPPQVILLHGVWMRALTLVPLAMHLRRAGYEVHRFDYSSLWGGPAPSAGALNSAGATMTPAVAPVEAPQGWYPSAVIVLFTDGENNQDPDPVMAAEVAADLGVRVYTVGVGTTAGATIEVEDMTVHTSLDETILQFIAFETGGIYYNAGNQEELDRIYGDLEPKLSIKPEEIEMTSVFAGLGMIVFLIGGLLSLLWFGHVP